MSKPDLSEFLEARKIVQMFFQWEGQKYVVKDAPHQIFDQWVSQFFERIVNVKEWDLIEKWNVIRVLLKKKFLVRNGDDLEVNSEIKFSDSEVQSEV